MRKNLLIVGDLNICILRDKLTRDFINLETLFTSRNLNQLILYPTYYYHMLNPSILDHVWSNLNFTSNSYVFKTPIADHIPSITFFNICTKMPNQILIFRDFSYQKMTSFYGTIKLSVQELKTSIESINSIEIVNIIETKLGKLEFWLISICNFYFPICKNAYRINVSRLRGSQRALSVSFIRNTPSSIR